MLWTANHQEELLNYVVILSFCLLCPSLPSQAQAFYLREHRPFFMLPRRGGQGGEEGGGEGKGRENEIKHKWNGTVNEVTVASQRLLSCMSLSSWPLPLCYACSAHSLLSLWLSSYIYFISQHRDKHYLLSSRTRCFLPKSACSANYLGNVIPCKLIFQKLSAYLFFIYLRLCLLFIFMLPNSYNDNNWMSRIKLSVF